MGRLSADTLAAAVLVGGGEKNKSGGWEPRRRWSRWCVVDDVLGHGPGASKLACPRTEGRMVGTGREWTIMARLSQARGAGLSLAMLSLYKQTELLMMMGTK